MIKLDRDCGYVNNVGTLIKCALLYPVLWKTKIWKTDDN